MTRRLLVLLGIFAISIVLYLTLDVRGDWGFVLTLRSEKLLGLLIFAVAISTATLLFHTATGNRILTPSLIGFDEFYIMLLSLSVFFLGSQTVMALPDSVVFLWNAGLMCVAALALFTRLLRSGTDLIRLVLTGIILGALFRSFSALVQRMIDPNEYATIAAESYASFSSLEPRLLLIAGLTCGGAIVLAWRMRYRLDVLALGRETAISLGEDYRLRILQVMALVAVLVSVSTALIGPVAFLGLLVVSLAYLVTPTNHHGALLISAGLISAITLIGGQVLMEHVFALTTPLSVVIDFVGGLLFLLLVFRRATA